MEESRRVVMGRRHAPGRQNDESKLRHRGTDRGSVEMIPGKQYERVCSKPGDSKNPSLDTRSTRETEAASGLYSACCTAWASVSGAVTGRTLHNAIKSYDMKEIQKFLYQEKIKPDAIDSKGKTPLAYTMLQSHPEEVSSCARGVGHLEIVECLLNAGADADKQFVYDKDNLGKDRNITPFTYLILKSPKNSIQIAKLLLEAKDKSGNNWFTKDALSNYMRAVVNCYYWCDYADELIRLLLEMGADPYFTSTGNNLPIIGKAIADKQLLSVRRFLDKGVSSDQSGGGKPDYDPVLQAKNYLITDQDRLIHLMASLQNCKIIKMRLSLSPEEFKQTYTSVKEYVPRDVVVELEGVWEELRYTADLTTHGYYLRKCVTYEASENMMLDMLSDIESGIQRLEEKKKVLTVSIKEREELVDLVNKYATPPKTTDNPIST